jgi:hypothetical protein
MKTIEPPIRSYVKSYVKSETPAHWIAGFFYYTTGVTLLISVMIILVTLVFMLFFNPLFVLWFVGIILYAAAMGGLLIFFGFCLWMIFGFVLFRWHKSYYDWNVGSSDGILMWLCTIGYNAVQSLFVFGYAGGSDTMLGNIIGGWNLFVVSLSLLALYFELKES